MPAAGEHAADPDAGSGRRGPSGAEQGPKGAARVRGGGWWDPPRLARWVPAILALHLLLGALLFEPILFPGGDNADYMILAEALRSGRGYRDIHLVGAPLHTKYPPVYPLLLAALGWIGGLQLFKLASLALAAGCVWLAWRLGRRSFGPGIGFLGAGLLAVNPTLLEYSHWELSETSFTFLVLAALWLGGGATRRARAAGLAAAVAAFLTRTAGLPLLLALVLHRLAARRPREAAATALVAVAALAGWALFQRLGPPGQPGYLLELLLADPYAPEAGRIGPVELVARVATNVWLYVSAVLPHALGLGSGVSVAAAHPFVVLVGAAAAGLALAGWLRESTREVTLHGTFLALYLALLTVWPAAWSDRRFLLPALPLLLPYALAGVAAVGAWALRREARGVAVPAAVAAGLALPAVLSAARLAPERVACVAAWRAGSPCDLPQMRSFYEAGRWAAAHTPGDAVIANRKPGLFFLFARRQGGLYRFSGEPALVIRGLEELGATHVVVDAISATTERYLLPAIGAFPQRFQPVYEEGEPPTWILLFRRDPRAARAPTRRSPEGAGGAASAAVASRAPARERGG